MFLTRVSIIVSTLYFVSCRIYQRCELARELRNFDVPEDEIPTWVCIAQHESDFNTSAMNPGSGDHGLFQISQLYWCSPPGDGYGCNSPCSNFRDDDIADDLQCIRRIHNEHRRISGDGFTAWVVYPLYCKEDNSRYTLGCFDEDTDFKPDTPSNVTDNEISTEDVDEYGDGYHFPALPTFSKKHEEQKSDYGDGYEFPQLPYSKASIYHFLSVEQSTERASKTLNKLPFSRTSIHDTSPIEEKKYRLSKFPYSRTDINYSTSTKETQSNQYPFSKESIHHFIPVQNESEESKIEQKLPLIAHVTEIASSGITTSEKPLFNTFVKMEFDHVNHVSYKTTEQQRQRTKLPPPVTSSPAPSTFTARSPYSTAEIRTTDKSTTQNFIPTMQDVVTTERVTTTKPFTARVFPTTTKQLFKYQLNTSTPKPYTTTKASGLNTFKPHLTAATTKPFITTIKPLRTSKIHTTPNVFDTSKAVHELFTTKATLQYTSTERAKTTERTIFSDSEGASSTYSPIRVKYLTPSTTLKPLATFKPFISQRIGLDQPQVTQKPFSHFTTSTMSTSPNAKIYQQTNQAFTTRKTSTFSILVTTTPKPSERQVTFAPDSFFSWLFNSQTLPPLIPPPRPSGNFPRPTTTRPTMNQRPGGLPRPPGRPPPDRPGQAPLGPELGLVTTRRPFPMRPNMPSRPSRPQQRPFGRPPGQRHRRPFRPGVGNTTSFYFKEDNLKRVKLTEEQLQSSTRKSKIFHQDRRITDVAALGRSDDFRKVKKGEVVITLDDNVMFVRTKYGYRLFRT